MTVELTRAATGRAAGPLGGVLLVVEHHWTWYRRNWRATAVSSILQPLLFLLAFGVGFGTLIDGTGRAAQATGGLDYLVWLAPALLCVSAVQTAVFDSTYPVLSGLKWQRHYLAMTATPIGPGQVVVGHLVWMMIKIGGCGAVYVAVIAAFGGVRSPGIVLALLIAMLAGAAVGALVTAFTAGVEDEGSAFTVLFRLVLIPMTLFSGTFFPVDRLPARDPAGHVGVAPVARHRAGPCGGARRRGGTARPRACGGPRWRWSRPGRRWPSCASGGGCTDDGAQPRRRRGRSGGGEPAAAAAARPAAPGGQLRGPARALVRRSATAARRTWLAIVSGIFEPVFYLVAMGQGLGSLIGTLPGPDGTPISYAAFIAPGCSPRPP